MMNAARRVRSKSPFRRSRSKSPFGNQGQGARSPFTNRRRSQSEALEDAEEYLHESEINIFQQLCLDRHDDSAAIEILLEDSTDMEAFQPEVPDLYAVSSESSGPSSHALSKSTPESHRNNGARASTVERKKPFFKRLFKSPKKNSADELTKFPQTPCNSFPGSQSSGPSDDMNYLPKPPSMVPRSRENMVMPAPAPLRNRVLSDRLDTFSNMSSISGSHTTGLLRPPMNFDRQESLGMDSIKDIRKALKEMEKQLCRATNKGERVSRQKVMRALFTVADSLEDMEEREFLRSELEGMMRNEHTSYAGSSRPLTVISSDGEKSDSTSEDGGDHTESAAPSSQLHGVRSGASEKESTPVGLLSSVGRLFGMSNDDKQAVEQALDDLLWTEFVATRKATGANSRGNKAPSAHVEPSKAEYHHQKPPKAQGGRRHHIGKNNSSQDIASNRRIETNRKSTEYHRPNEGRRVPFEPRHNHNQMHRTRSWWRKHPTSSRAPIQEGYDDGGNAEDAEGSFSSDEYPDYLPTSITVRTRNGRNKNENSHPAAKSQRYRVKLVETESRYGYEMGSTTSSMR